MAGPPFQSDSGGPLAKRLTMRSSLTESRSELAAVVAAVAAVVVEALRRLLVAWVAPSCLPRVAASAHRCPESGRTTNRRS